MATDANINIRAKNKTKRAFASLNKDLQRMKGSLFSAKSAVAGLVGVGGFAALVITSSKVADSLAKTSDKLGITTEALGGLRHAGDLTGVSQTALDKALQKMIVSVRDANNGLMTYKRSYDELGINIKELQQLSPEQQFARIAEALNKVENNTKKVGIAYDIFGAKGTGLLNTLALGEEGLKKISEEAKAYGIALNRVDAAKIEAANDAMTRVQSVIKGVGTTIAVNLAPYIEAIGNKFAAASVESNGFKTQIMEMVESTVGALGVLADAVFYFETAWQVVKLGAVATFDGIISAIHETDKSLSFFLSKIPGIDIQPSGELAIWAKASSAAVYDVAAGLEELLNQTAPSEALKKTLNEITETAEKTATSVAKTKEVLQFGDDEQSNLDRMFEAADKQMNRMVMLFDIEEKKRRELLKVEEQIAKSRYQVAEGLTGQMASLMSSSSKKEFEIGKKFAIANALIKGYESVVSSYAAGASVGGPWLGAAYAVAAGLATKVHIDNIKRAQFGGGGGISVGGGGVASGSSFNGGAPPAPITGQQPATAVSGNQGTSTFNLIGSDSATFTGSQVNDMFDKLRAAIDRGDRVLFSKNSRQALELEA